MIESRGSDRHAYDVNTKMDKAFVIDSPVHVEWKVLVHTIYLHKYKPDALVRLVRGLVRIPEAMLLAKHCRKFKRGYCFGPGGRYSNIGPEAFCFVGRREVCHKLLSCSAS